VNKIYIFLLSNILLLIILVDCRCQRADLVVNKLTIEMPENLQDFKKLLQEALNNDPYFHVSSTEKNAGILNLSLSVSRFDNKMLLVAHLARKNQELMAFAEIALSEIPNFEAEALRKALGRSVAYLRQQLVNTNKSQEDSHYVQKIKEASEAKFINPELLTNALRLAGKKQDQQSVSYIIKLLGSTDNLGIAHACLTALAQLKDASSLPAIIDFAENKPALIRRQAIVAVRQMPSQLSAEWLVVMAYGHDDPTVRKEALEGLREVEKYLAEQK